MADLTDPIQPSVEPGVEISMNEDEARLEELGRKQAMKRHFNIYSLIFMASCESATWEALTSTMTQSLVSGGTSSLVWGFLASAVGSTLLSLSISEFASIVPTAGGQYHYVAELSPPRYRRFLSWFTAWLTIWSWFLMSVSGTFAAAMALQSYVILFVEDYTYQRWHTSLIMIAIMTWSVALGVFGIRWLHRLTFLGITLHIVGYFVVLIWLVVNVNPKNTAEVVFTDFTNLSGWPNDGVAWSIGLLSSALGFMGWDCCSHMAEEMKHAARDLPRAMYGCVILSAMITWPFVIALVYCITDISGVLNGPVGTIAPLVQLVYNVSGGNQAATIGVTCYFMIMACLVAGPSGVTATSRIIWSFAQEGGLPKFLAKIDSRQVVPVNALLLVWFSVCALSLIYIGNSTAFYGFASGVTVTLMFTYLLPIVVNLLWGIRRNNLKAGPFSLGRYGRIINIASVIWAVYIIIFLVFPTTLPVTAVNMNYASLVFGFGALLPVVTWYIYGHKTYHGVVHEVREDMEQDKWAPTDDVIAAKME